MTTKEAVKRALLLLGSYDIAYNTSTFLHELGHAVAAWLSGGQVFGITLHPFSWSYSYAVSLNPVFLTAGGVLFSSLAGVLIFVCLVRWPKPYLLPLLLIGPITLINNGDYLLVDYLIKSGGDACSLAAMGIAPLIIIAGSIVSLVLGFVLAVYLVRKANLLEGNFKMRLAVICLGILSYSLLAFVWNFFFNRSEALIWLTYTASGIVLCVLFAAVSRPPKIQEFAAPFSLSWKPILTINITAVLLVVFLLTGPLSGKRRNAYGIETFSERPDDFPKVLTPPAYATEVFYTYGQHPDAPYYSLNYEIPTTTEPDEIVNYLEDLHREHGYLLLTHWSDDPNILCGEEWIMGDSSKSYRREWLKITSSIYWSSPWIWYLRQDDENTSAFVVHWAKIDPRPERFEAYAEKHPDQFSEEQRARLREIISQHQMDKPVDDEDTTLSLE